MIAWGQAAVDANGHGWYMHALAMAHFQAGNCDEAIEWTKKSRETGWHAELQDMLMCLIKARSGGIDDANRYPEKVREWLEDRDQRDRGPSTDWLELQVLLPEAETSLK